MGVARENLVQWNPSIVTKEVSHCEMIQHMWAGYTLMVENNDIQNANVAFEDISPVETNEEMENVALKGKEWDFNTCQPAYTFTIENNDVFSSSTTWDRSTTHPKFNLTGVRTHDLQIMTVHFMSLRRLL